MKDSFIIYTENKDMVDELSNEQAGILFKAIFEYQNGGKVEIEDLATRIVFLAIKKQIDRCSDKYEEIRKKRSEAGKKGMDKRWTEDNSVTDAPEEDTKGTTNHNKPITNDNKPITNDNTVITEDNKSNLNVHVHVPVLKEVSPKGDTKKRFTPPTREEVQAYITEKGYNVSADRFVDFYASKGWMVGKNHMKDWRAAVRTWNQSENKTRGKPENRFNNFQQREYDYADLERKLLAAQRG